MNYKIIEDYIEQYKNRFPEINQMEIYKWKAVKHFQENWDIEAVDFADMLKKSLDKTKNLLGSGNYFPRRMIKTFAQKEPEEVRRLFKILFDQTLHLEERHELFKAGIDSLASKIETDKDNHYQDHRAIVVYLCLRFPRDFTNVLEFQQLCSLIKAELLTDDQLLNLHHKRLLDADEFYQDPAYTILTQDFIYACANHLNKPEDIPEEKISVTVEYASVEDFTIKHKKTALRGRIVDYNAQNKRNSITGITGEEFVLNYEREKLEGLSVKSIHKKLKHTSVEEGDGLGYDIKSVDENGNEIYIEVKATSGSFLTPFYITRNELVCSQDNPDKYRLYRLYDFDHKKRTGKIKIFSGDLSHLCTEPINYEVNLKNN
jgi:hypothetical protein